MKFNLATVAILAAVAQSATVQDPIKAGHFDPKPVSGHVGAAKKGAPASLLKKNKRADTKVHHRRSHHYSTDSEYEYSSCTDSELEHDKYEKEESEENFTHRLAVALGDSHYEPKYVKDMVRKDEKSHKLVNEAIKSAIHDHAGDAFPFLIRTIHKERLYKKIRSEALRKALSTKRGRAAFGLVLHRIPLDTVYRALGTKYELVKDLLSEVPAFQDYMWIPSGFFSKTERVAFVYEHFKATGVNRQYFLKRFTLKQLLKIQNYPSFHNGELTVRALNALFMGKVAKDTKPAKFIQSLKMKTFMASLYTEKQGKSAPRISAKVGKNLPVNALKDLTYEFNPADAKYYTSKQADEAGKMVRGVDMNDAKKDTLRSIKDPKGLRRVAKNLNDESLEKLTAEQWNTLFQKTKNCKLLTVTKIDNLSKIKFTAECFAELNPEVQSVVMTKHTNLEDNILSRVDENMAQQWYHNKSSDSGLAVLDHIASKNKAAIIANLGAHKSIDEEEHPCASVSLSDLKDYKALSAHMSTKCATALPVDDISVSDVKDRAEVICKRDDAFELLNDLHDEEDGKKKSFWSKLSTPVFTKLTGEGSTLAKHMTKDVFDLLVPANRAAMRSQFVMELAFLKELNKEEIATLAETAFEVASKVHVAIVDLEKVADAQLPHVSAGLAEASESFFTAVQPAVLAKMTKERRALLKAKQWSAIQPAAFKSIFVSKEAMASVPAEATKTWTAVQLKDIAKVAIEAITAEQVAVMGAEIADEKLSAAAFLKANKASLNGEARAALAKRFPESSASALAVSSAVVAAVTLALLA